MNYYRHSLFGRQFKLLAKNRKLRILWNAPVIIEPNFTHGLNFGMPQE